MDGPASRGAEMRPFRHGEEDMVLAVDEEQTQERVLRKSNDYVSSRQDRWLARLSEELASWPMVFEVSDSRSSNGSLRGRSDKHGGY